MQLSPASIVVGEQSWQELMSPASTNAQNWWDVLAGTLCRPPALCLCKINNPFLKQ
jgi:hypothetical protein